MDAVIISFTFLFGLILGSFINCLVWRIHEEEDMGGRSHCPKCLAKIHWYDNIPILSFIILGGHCRNCRKTISWQYPLVELISGILFSLSSYLLFQEELMALALMRDWVFIFTLIVIFIYDARWREVPMGVVWPATAVIFILSLLIGNSFLSVVISSAIGAAFFLLQYLLTKRKGLGEGDIWIGLMLGAAFPDLMHLALAIFSAYMIGSVVAIYLLISDKKDLKSKVALGPFLALGAVISLLAGDVIIAAYKSLFLF